MDASPQMYRMGLNKEKKKIEKLNRKLSKNFKMKIIRGVSLPRLRHTCHVFLQLASFIGTH